MAEPMELSPELTEKLKAAKTAEEVSEILGEELKKPAKRKMSLDELDSLAGGVPEYFVINGVNVTPEQVYIMTEAVRQTLGMDFAVDYLRVTLASVYPGHLDAVVYAYQTYGPNMWGWLETELGY